MARWKSSSPAAQPPVRCARSATSSARSRVPWHVRNSSSTSQVRNRRSSAPSTVAVPARCRVSAVDVAVREPRATRRCTGWCSSSAFDDAGGGAPVDRLQLVEDEQRRRREHLSRAPPGRPRSSPTASSSATAGARSAQASWRCARTAAVLPRAPSSVSHATGAVSRAATCERNVVLPHPAAATTLTRGCAPGPTTGSSSRSRGSPRGAGRRVRDRRTVGCPSAPDTAHLARRRHSAPARPSRTLTLAVGRFIRKGVNPTSSAWG